MKELMKPGMYAYSRTKLYQVLHFG